MQILIITFDKEKTRQVLQYLIFIRKRFSEANVVFTQIFDLLVKTQILAVIEKAIFIAVLRGKK